MVKLWNAHFWTTLGYSFTCHQRKFNLLKSSLGSCRLKMIKMYRKLDRKSPFTYAATWWSSTSKVANRYWPKIPRICDVIWFVDGSDSIRFITFIIQQSLYIPVVWKYSLRFFFLIFFFPDILFLPYQISQNFSSFNVN